MYIVHIIKKEILAVTRTSMYSKLHEVQRPIRNRSSPTHILAMCRVGYFFLFEEIPIAITATISVAKLTIKFIASYVTISGTPFPQWIGGDRCPPCDCCTREVYHIEGKSTYIKKVPFVFF